MNNRKTKTLLRTWHRRIGLLSSLFIIWLALSGLVLNHSDKMGLNLIFSNGPLVKSLYGLDGDKPPQIMGYRFGQDYFVLDGRFYQNEKSELNCHQNIKNAVRADSQLIFLCEEDLLLYTQEGQLVDKIALSLLSVSIDDIAMTTRGDFVLVSQGEHYHLDLLSLETKHLDEKQNLILPIEKELIPHQVFSNVENNRFEGISIEKILLDAHSGRMMGDYGVYLVDFFALMFVLMAISGIYLFVWKNNSEDDS